MGGVAWAGHMSPTPAPGRPRAPQTVPGPARKAFAARQRAPPTRTPRSRPCAEPQTVDEDRWGARDRAGVAGVGGWHAPRKAHAPRAGGAGVSLGGDGLLPGGAGLISQTRSPRRRGTGLQAASMARWGWHRSPGFAPGPVPARISACADPRALKAGPSGGEAWPARSALVPSLWPRCWV